MGSMSEEAVGTPAAIASTTGIPKHELRDRSYVCLCRKHDEDIALIVADHHRGGTESCWFGNSGVSSSNALATKLIQ